MVLFAKNKILKSKSIKSKSIKSESKKHKFVIMAIFKNEEEYMEEWLEHHINQGVTKFYLYCNDHNLKKYSYLNNYKKHIELIDWTKKKNIGSYTIQKQAYTHCIRNYNNEYHYIMMLDLDEFIIHLDKKKKVIDYLNLLGLFKTKSLKIPRYNFGSNGHIKKTKGSVVENYTKHEKIYSSFKTIANSIFIKKNTMFKTVHDFNYIAKKGKIYNSFLSKKNKILKSIRKNRNETKLVINHYYTKSYEECINRCKLWKNGGINPYQFRQNCDKKFKKIDKNEVSGYDYLKKKLKK